MLNRSTWSAPALALSVCLLSACGADKASESRGEDRPVPVTTQVVQSGRWSDSLQTLGTAKAVESVTLTAKVSEIVQDVHFESGQEVTAGQRLITLKGDAAQAALAQAEATFVEADQLYRRQNELAQQQLIARSQLDTQRALRNAAEGRVRQARADIGDRSVRAPFAGVLGIRQVSPGSLITPSTVIATLDDISHMHVDFQVPEADLSVVHIGEKVTGTAAAWPGETFEGVVSIIDARIDAQTRAVTVRADFGNDERKLRPGMLMDVKLFQPERQALVIPEIAVIQVGRESYVYRVKPDGSVERVDVDLGVRRDGKVEIRKGLADGQRIVVDGTGKLRPGLKIVDGKAPATPAASADAGKAKQG